MPASQKSIVGAVAPDEIGKASGTFTTMRWLGGVFGVAIAVAVFAAGGGYSSPREFSDGFAAAMAVTAGLSLAGAIAGFALAKKHGSVRPVGADEAAEWAALGNGVTGRRLSARMPSLRQVERGASVGASRAGRTAG